MSEEILMLQPKKWKEFQHYKNRRPPWVKLHRSLLEDKQFSRLPVASKALAPLFWLLASESPDGIFNASTDELEFRLRMPAKDIEVGRKSLIDNGFFVVASGVLAECLPVAVPEKRREERETEANATAAPDGFAEFYKAYPKKVGKPAAQKAFKAAKVNGHLPDLLADINRRVSAGEWSVEKAQFIPNPATYLNQRRWEDEVAQQPVNPWAGAI